MTVWRPIPGYADYYASIDGEILSAKSGRVLAGGPMGGGYTGVAVPKPNGRYKKRYSHQLVMEAFAGPRPSGMVTMHINDNPQDNRLINLCYGSIGDNIRDCIRKGRNPRVRPDTCMAGHERNSENAYQNRNGHYICRQCRRDRERGVKRVRRKK